MRGRRTGRGQRRVQALNTRARTVPTKTELIFNKLSVRQQEAHNLLLVAYADYAPRRA